MNTSTIIVGFFIALTPPYVTPGSNIACAGCGDVSYELIPIGNRPASGECGEDLGEGQFCKLERIKKYYKCRRRTCKAVTVKNKQYQSGERRTCNHDNRFVLEPPITPTSEGSSSERVVTSEIIHGHQYFHFM
jgi:hypothetical protein